MTTSAVRFGSATIFWAKEGVEVDLSDGDELYEVFNAEKRVNETNSNPVIICALHGPYDSSLIGHVATTRMAGVAVATKRPFSVDVSCWLGYAI